MAGEGTVATQRENVASTISDDRHRLS